MKRHFLTLPLVSMLYACASVSPQTPDAPYRALGTEPFWSVTIEGGRMVYEAADGARIAVAAPSPRPSFNGHRYETPTLTVDVTHARCSDGMSDNVYPDTVMVVAAGRELKGCGGLVTRP